MKKGLLIGCLSISLVAVGATSLAMLSKQTLKPIQTRAVSPYTITEAGYEVAFMESYVQTADTSSVDRPFGQKELAKHIYDDTGSATKIDYSTTFLDMGIPEEHNNSWRFSSIKPYFKDNVMRLVFRAGTSSNNIFDTSKYDAVNFPDEFAIAADITANDGANATKGGAMISEFAFDEVNDIQIYWRSSEARRFYIYYQLDGETAWKKYAQSNLQDSGKIIGNYQGTRGWDTYGYSTFKSSSWSTHELKGSKARLAFVIASNVNETDMQLSGICINANQSAVRYLNALSYFNNICSTSRQNLNDGFAQYTHNQDLFQLATEHADGSYLANYEVAGTKTTEGTILSFYNYLVGEIPALGDAKSAS